MELNKTVVIGIATSATSLVVGSFAGYLVAKRRLERKYEEIAQQEIAEARRKFKMFYKKEEFSRPGGFLQDDDDEEEFDNHLPMFDQAVTAVLKTYDPPQNFALDDHNPGTNGHPLAVDIPVQRNVFEEQEMTDDDTEEQFPVIGPRESGRPYVIDFATFDAGELGYRNITLTNYADGALVEEGDRNEDLNVAQDLIGEESLEHLGWERGQPNVVYVRNDRLRVDYEVISDERRFGADMLGGFEDDSESVEKAQELRRPRTPNAGPRARFSNYNPGGVVRAAGE